MTKLHTTMNALLSAIVASQGPITSKAGYCGYGLRMGRVREVYKEAGFNPNNKAFRNHIETWQFLGWNRLDGDFNDDEAVLWFPVPAGQEIYLFKYAELNMIPFPKVLLKLEAKA